MIKNSQINIAGGMRQEKMEKKKSRRAREKERLLAIDDTP